MKDRSVSSYYMLLLYVISFYLIWSLYEIFVKPEIGMTFWETVGEMIRSGIKILVWVVPCIILLKKYQAVVFVPLSTLFTNKIKWLKVMPILLFFTIYLLMGSWLQFGNIAVRSSFQLETLLGSFLFVGLTEELVFRGWLLNAFLEKMRKWPAILLNALLFLLIHFPVWLKTGVFIDNILSGDFLVIIILSIIFSLSFFYTKNLLVPIFLHMYWDLLVILFY